MADITGRDSDGELIATPTEWDEDESGAPPKIRIHVPRRPQPGTAAGVGDRALLRVEKPDDGEGARLSRPRHQGGRSRQDPRARHLPRAARRRRTAGAGRQETGRPRTEHRQGRHAAAPRTAISSASNWCARAALGWPPARSRSGSVRWQSEKAVSLIAIHAHEIPQAFSPAALREAEEAKPATLKGREDWRDVPLVTIDPPGRQGSRRRGACASPIPIRTTRAAIIVNVAIADVAFYVRPGSALDRDALDARQFGLFPGSRRADAARAHLQRSVLAGAGRAARRAGGADGDRRRRPQALAQLSPHPDALGGETELRAGAGRDRRPARRHHRPPARSDPEAALCRLCTA